MDGMGLAPLTDTINNLRTDYQSCEQAPDRCIAPMDIIRNASGMYGYMVIYAYSIFKIHEVQDLQTTGVINLVKTITDVFQQSIISLIMLIVFGFLVIALAAMLLIRGIMLWVYAIFSPLFSFKFVAGKVFGGDDNGLFDIKQFLGLAFVPAIVSLALSMGLLVA